jgi:hypothetical protein
MKVVSITEAELAHSLFEHLSHLYICTKMQTTLVSVFGFPSCKHIWKGVVCLYTTIKNIFKLLNLVGCHARFGVPIDL